MGKEANYTNVISKLFHCPLCTGNIKYSKDCFICTNKHTFIFNNNILYLSSQFTKKDIQLSRTRWESLYKKETIKKVTLNDALANSYIKSYLKIIKKEEIKNYFIDLGAGLGLMSLVINKQFKKLPILIDFSEDALIKAQKIFKDNKAEGVFIYADITENIYISNASKFFFSSMSLEYFKKIENAFIHLHNALQRNGKLVFILPKISLSTLTFHQLRSGDIPFIPVLRHVYEFIHLHVFRSRFLKTGYNISYSIGFIKKVVERTGFTIIRYGDLDMEYDLRGFKPKIIRVSLKKLTKHPLVSPLVYFEVIKK